MEWLDSHIDAPNRPFQKAPKVFDAIGVDVLWTIFYCMIRMGGRSGAKKVLEAFQEECREK
jgi:hypothetical protein